MSINDAVGPRLAAPAPRPQGSTHSDEALRRAWADSSLNAGSSEGAEQATETIIVSLNGEGNFTAARSATTEAARKRAVTLELLRVNDRSMGLASPSLDALHGLGLIDRVESLPMSNTLLVHVPRGAVREALAALEDIPGIASAQPDEVITIDDLERTPVEPESAEAVAPNVEWNVAKVRAPEVWAQGVRGEGITVGIIDSGVDVEHLAVHDNYRGLNPDGSYSNDYNFFDSVNGRKSAPYDDNSHGTHVTGTVLGEAGGRGYGMAPDANWISAKILNANGSGSRSRILRALEWMVAPRDQNGKNPDPTKAPDVINNSWGSPDDTADKYRRAWQAFDEAGITVVTSAGNNGPEYGTLGAPGSYPEGITVAATTRKDELADFSSRGPSPWPEPDGQSHVPDVSAPGAGITSSVPGGGYDAYSGTSMAAPAVSGVVALLLSRHNDLTNDEVAQALTSSAVDLGAPGYAHGYGWGRVDAMAALAAADAIIAARDA